MDFARKAAEGAGSFMFEMDIVLNVQAGGRTFDVSMTYTGVQSNTLLFPSHSDANLTVTTPSETSRHRVFTYDSTGTSWIFNPAVPEWLEMEDKLLLPTFVKPIAVFGSSSSDVEDLVRTRRLDITDRQSLDDGDVQVVSGKLTAEDVPGAIGELDVTYRIGAGDNRLRRMDVKGDMSLGGFAPLLGSIEATQGAMDLSVRFHGYQEYPSAVWPHLIPPRFSHGAMLLDDGRVLVNGGLTSEFGWWPILLAHLVHDFSTSTWSDIAPLTEDERAEWLEDVPVIFSSAVKLTDGRVMVVGTNRGDEEDEVVEAAAVFDPAQNSWMPLPSPSISRFLPNPILLLDGRVLVAGGVESNSDSFLNLASLGSAGLPQPVNAVEIFDPATGEWRQAASTNESDPDQSITLLGDGRVLIVRSASVEVYDPSADTWTLTTMPADVHTPRPVPIVLNDGRVLITGMLPYDPTTGRLTGSSGAVIYDPRTGTWTPTGLMTHARVSHTLTLLPDGRVIAVGGENPLGSEDPPDYEFPPDNRLPVIYSTTEIYDPGTNSWSPGPDLSEPRSSHSATLLPDGRIFLVGGIEQLLDDEGQPGQRYPTNSSEFVHPQ